MSINGMAYWHRILSVLGKALAYQMDIVASAPAASQNNDFYIKKKSNDFNFMFSIFRGIPLEASETTVLDPVLREIQRTRILKNGEPCTRNFFTVAPWFSKPRPREWWTSKAAGRPPALCCARQHDLPIVTRMKGFVRLESYASIWGGDGCHTYFFSTAISVVRLCGYINGELHILHTLIRECYWKRSYENRGSQKI